MYEYRAKLIRCVDGDTADFLVDLGFKVFKEIRTRFLGVDTPERGHVDFNIAKNKLQLLLENQKDEEGWIVIKTGKTGKYGRWLVDIQNVNITMAERWPYE
jgi:endonuclease YncB( thermonuclease family)|tara:strand:- start:146 stop:448 length:303 start_codon:yes stop_codon:yes gene_type:complete